jgi:hypothetical protein
VDRIDLAEDSDKWRGCSEHCNEPSGAIKCGEFLAYPRSCLLLKKDCAARSYK